MKAARERPGLHGLVGQVPEQRQGRGPKAPEGLNRHRHEGQGGGQLPIRMLGGVPGSGRKPGGMRSAHSKEGSRLVFHIDRERRKKRPASRKQSLLFVSFRWTAVDLIGCWTRVPAIT
jgi:hypothetical protein